MNDDLSNLFEKLNIDKNSISPEMLDNIMNMVNNFSQNSSDNNSENSSPEIDIETILKMKSVLDKMNKNGNCPRSRLLQDLKPYLNQSKKNKIDQYMKIDKMLELLPLLGGEVTGKFYSDNQALMFSLIFLLF